MPRVFLFVLVLPLALDALPTTAADECYAVNSTGSTVSFEVKQAGAPFRGTFRRFGGELCLAQERVVRIDVWLEPDSVSTDLPEIDAALKDKDFFDTRAHSRISFASSGIEMQADRQLVSGTLEVKGKRRQVNAPFRLLKGDGRLDVSGSFTLNRLDYSIGTGEWSDTRWLAAEVKVDFKVALSRR
jgi:polyisoprenoid-binding protein YceI